MPASPPSRDVVLLGVGHTNAHVLLKWRTNPIPNARLTCVSDHGFATYSGMLPGLLAGRYEPDDLRIDLVRLCAAARARLIIDEVTGLDAVAGALQFRDRAAIRYNALSIGVGSRPALPTGAGPRDVAIKPIQTFVDRLDAALANAADSTRGPLRVAVIGGGAAGAELAMSLPHHVRNRHPRRQAEFTLLDASDRVLASRPARTRRLFLRAAERVGLRVLTGRRVVAASDEGLRLSDGTTVPRDLAVWATSATGPPVLQRLGLTTNPAGRVLTRPTLQTINDDRIFAVGDAGVIQNNERPGAGVYAVRQGPYLWRNLNRLLSGRPLRSYRPQESPLAILNTADGRAILTWRGISLEGAAFWRIKDAIDRSFVRKHQHDD